MILSLAHADCKDWLNERHAASVFGQNISIIAHRRPDGEDDFDWAVADGPLPSVSGRVVDVVRVAEDALKGGMSQLGYVRKRDLAAAARAFPVTELYRRVAFPFRSGNREFFGVFYDRVSPKTGKLQRTVVDVVYPREYKISVATRLTLMTVQRVSLVDLDQAIARHRGPVYQELNLDDRGEPRSRPESARDAIPGRYRWILTRDAGGRALRVVFFEAEGAALPEIVSVDRPNDSLLGALERFKTEVDP